MKDKVIIFSVIEYFLNLIFIIQFFISLTISRLFSFQTFFKLIHSKYIQYFIAHNAWLITVFAIYYCTLYAAAFSFNILLLQELFGPKFPPPTYIGLNSILHKYAVYRAAILLPIFSYGSQSMAIRRSFPQYCIRSLHSLFNKWESFSSQV